MDSARCLAPEHMRVVTWVVLVAYAVGAFSSFGAIRVWTEANCRGILPLSACSLRDKKTPTTLSHSHLHFLRLRGGGWTVDHALDSTSDDFPTLEEATAARKLARALDEGALNREGEDGGAGRAARAGEMHEEDGIGAQWDVKQGEGVGLWSDQHFLLLRHVQSGVALELAREATSLSFIFHTHKGSEARAYLGAGGPSGVAFAASVCCPRLLRALEGSPGDYALACGLKPLPSSGGIVPGKGMTFGRWRIETSHGGAQGVRRIVIRHSMALDAYVELRRQGFVMRSGDLPQALVVESQAQGKGPGRMLWVSEASLSEKMQDFDSDEGQRSPAQIDGDAEGEVLEESGFERGLDVLAEGGVGAAGLIRYDGDLEPFEATCHALAERQSSEEEESEKDRDRRAQAQFYDEEAAEARVVAEEKEEYLAQMRAAGLNGGPVLDQDLIDYDSYYTRSQQAGLGGLGGARESEGFYHPSKGLGGVLNTKAKEDPSTVPEFKYKGLTLGDLIADSFSQRQASRDAWDRACQAMVAAGEAPDLGSARRVLEDDANATTAQVRQALFLVDQGVEASPLAALGRMAVIRREYQDYDDNDIDQSLLGVGKFDEFRAQASSLAVVQARSGQPREAVSERESGHGSAFLGGVTVKASQFEDLEREHRWREGRLRTGLLQEAASKLGQAQGPVATLPLGASADALSSSPRSGALAPCWPHNVSDVQEDVEDSGQVATVDTVAEGYYREIGQGGHISVHVLEQLVQASRSTLSVKCLLIVPSP